MAFGFSAYSEAAFSSETNDVIAYPQGTQLTHSLGTPVILGQGETGVSGLQATITNAGVVAGTSVLVTPSGVQITTSIGDEDTNIGVPVNGQELSISNKTFTQDTLTAFGQAPFSTQSPSLFEIPSVEIEATVGAGQLASLLLTTTIGTFSTTAGAQISVNVTEHTINSSLGSPSISADANVTVSGTSMTMSLGSEDASADFTAEVTGQQLTMTLGEEAVTGAAIVTLTGISATFSIGSVVATPSKEVDVTGSQMTMSIGEEVPSANARVIPTGISLTSSVGNVNITAWAEIDPGVSNVWTEVDLAA